MNSVPDAFRCPLTGQVLSDPVRTSDGQVYEREAIEEWLCEGSETSPLTGAKLRNTDLVSHRALQAAIAAYMAALETEVAEECRPSSPYEREAWEAGARSMASEENSHRTPLATPYGEPLSPVLEDEEIQHLYNGLQKVMCMAAEDLAAEKAPAAAWIADAMEHSKKVVLQVTNAEQTVLSNGDSVQQQNIGFSSGDPGAEGGQAPMSARLVEPCAQVQESVPMPPISGMGDKGRFPQVQATPLSRSRQRPGQSRSPSPEVAEAPQVGSVRMGSRQASSSNLRSSDKLGHNRPTPRRSGLSPGSVPLAERSGAFAPASRPRPRSPGDSSASAPSASSSPLTAGRAARLSQGGLAASAPSIKAPPRGRVVGSGASTRPAELAPSRRQSGGTGSHTPGQASPPQPRGPGRPSAGPRGGGPAKEAVRRPRDMEEGIGLPPTPQGAEEAAINLEEVDEAGRTHLIIAARGGDAPRTKELLISGSVVDAEDACRCTALMYAATYGHTDVARCLVEHGANVDAHSEDSWTPLIAAAYNGRLAVVQYLLSQRANIESADQRGWTSLMHVAFNGNNKVLRCLLDHHAKVDAEDSDGRTALVYAAYHGHLESVRCLLDRSEKVHRRSSAEGDGPLGPALMFAAHHGHVEVVRMLLEVAAVSAQTQHQALRLAYQHGHDGVVELLSQTAQVEMPSHR